MTQQELSAWNRAFFRALNMSADVLTHEDRELVVRLRENGRGFAYAAARVRMRVQRRQRLALAGW